MEARDHLQLLSNAKINIGLRVLDKRDDGFHNIETFFQEIDLHDTISFTRQAGGISVTCDHPLVPDGEQNLAHKAAMAIKSATGCDAGVSIDIKKQIPVGAGLGGGSSNAAAVLKGLNTLWDLHLSNEKLKQLAAELGSDVPFFIEGGTAFAHGRGEILQKINYTPGFYCLLIYPNIEISTKWSYKNYNLCLTISKKNVKLTSSFFDDFELGQFKTHLVNDLENVAFIRYPVLEELKEKLYGLGAEFALMSGSGSTVFALFNSLNLAQKAKGEMDQAYELFVAAPIGRR